MSSQDPTVSLLIVSWNTRDLLSRCLESIREHLSDIAYEVIVVDNGSMDSSVSLLTRKAHHDPRLRVIYNQENLGFARGTNQAFEASKGRFIALVNSDIQLLDETVGELVNYLDSHDRVGAVSCHLVSPDGRPQAIHRSFPSLGIVVFSSTRVGRWIDRKLLRSHFHRRYRLHHVPRTGAQPIDQAAAALLVLRRPTVDRINGLLDERFPILGNDVDLCRRIWNAGMEVHVLYDHRVVHERSASLRKIPSKQRRDLVESWLRTYYAKHEPPLKRALVKLIGLLG